MQLTLLGTAPAQRGQGIGKHLVRAAVHAAATAGAAKLRLVTQGRNVRAVRTYQRAGFLLADATCYFHKWWE
jgi:ribosomal protein S18 acetylase RimI-like enzyme